MISPFEETLKSLSSFLAKERIPYVILGGIAVLIYGEPRLTADVDVNIILDKHKINDFLNKARKYHFYPLGKETEKIAGQAGVILLQYVSQKLKIKVDVIIAENELEFAAIERGKIKKIGLLKVKFISPEDLIVHKMASTRPRDAQDVQGIILRQRKKIDIRYIYQWLRRLDKIEAGHDFYQCFKNLLRNCEK